MADAFIDTKGVERLLEGMDFSSNSQKRIIKGAARKGGNILKDEVKNKIPTSNDFPEIAKIRKGVKTVTSKSKSRPGVNILIKGRDVPVSPGVGRDWWDLPAYAALAFFGNYKTPNRRHKTGKRKGVVGGQGDVRGIAPGNPFRMAQRSKGKQAIKAMSKAMLREIQKEWIKLSRRGN